MKCKLCNHPASKDESEQGNYYVHGDVIGSIICKSLNSHCKSCGYEFSDGMNYCPICGLRRKRCGCKVCTDVVID